MVSLMCLMRRSSKDCARVQVSRWAGASEKAPYLAQKFINIPVVLGDTFNKGIELLDKSSYLVGS
jgi:hypothetical protein